MGKVALDDRGVVDLKVVYSQSDHPFTGMGRGRSDRPLLLKSSGKNSSTRTEFKLRKEDRIWTSSVRLSLMPLKLCSMDAGERLPSRTGLSIGVFTHVLIKSRYKKDIIGVVGLSNQHGKLFASRRRQMQTCHAEFTLSSHEEQCTPDLFIVCWKRDAAK